MDIPDFISTAILMSIGIVLAELFIHYIKEKSSRNNIIISLFKEVLHNLDTVEKNIEIMGLFARDKPVSFNPFKTVAYVRYNRYIDSKLLRIIDADCEGHLSLAYNQMEELNMWITVKGYVLAGDFDLMFEDVIEELEEFMKVLKSKKYFKKLFKNHSITSLTNEKP
jgi:hypothetical protein